MEMLIAFWLICGIVGGLIANGKNAGVGGFFAGVLLGPLGVLASFALDGRETCRRCGTRLNGNPEICPQCRTLRRKSVGRTEDDVPDEWFDT